jgi:hypothetical protein
LDWPLPLSFDVLVNGLRLLGYGLICLSLTVAWLTDSHIGRLGKLTLILYFLSAGARLVYERFLVGSLAAGMYNIWFTLVTLMLGAHLIWTQLGGVLVIWRWLRAGRTA